MWEGELAGWFVDERVVLVAQRLAEISFCHSLIIHQVPVMTTYLSAQL
jgi:hypothetical protein